MYIVYFLLIHALISPTLSFVFLLVQHKVNNLREIICVKCLKQGQVKTPIFSVGFVLIQLFTSAYSMYLTKSGGSLWLHGCKACLFLIRDLTNSGPGSDLDASFFSDYRRKKRLQAGR